MIYLYDVTRDSYDNERSKYAFEGHNSWLWCLVLANFEDELKVCAETLRRQLSTQVMLDEFNGAMMGNWSERQYNKSGKLKYIDTITRMNYVYTLTGTRELHRTQFLTDRNKLLDARYGAGNYADDVMTFTVVRQSTDRVSSLTLVSNDLYYFGYKLNNRWLQGPTICKADESLDLTFEGTLATNDPLMLGGASCIKELNMTDMGSQLNGDISFSNCTSLERLIMPQTEFGAYNGNMTFGNTSKLQYVDFTDQANISGVIDLSKHTRLDTFKASGTRLTRVVLADGAPVTTLELPATLTTLVLRHFPLLRMNGLHLESASNVIALNMAGCPYLSWETILDTCPNIRRVRIEGMSGVVRSARMRAFMSGWSGFDKNGNEQELPAFTGTVRLADYVDDFDTLEAFFRDCGLTLLPNEYTDYWFDDNEADTENITNEDNQTGFHYENTYTRSGHVARIHDKCEVVSGLLLNGVMKMTKLSKSNFSRTAGGSVFDPADSEGFGYDLFLYVPRYWYKGVNDYKNGHKHFLLSSLENEPTAANITRQALSELWCENGKAVVSAQVGDVVAMQTASYNTYRVSVKGMNQARFPNAYSNNIYCAFTDADDKILSIHNLYNDTSGNSDYNISEGGYDFRSVPEDAEWLYFSVPTSLSQTTEVIVTDSDQIEAIEPDWVEHKPELVGIYQGFVKGMTTGGTLASDCIGLRSISGKVVSRGSGVQVSNAHWNETDGNPTYLPKGEQCNGTAQDYFNLARIRGNGYVSIPYETSKNLANLFMAWAGTRAIEDKIGNGCPAGYTTGENTNNIAFGDSTPDPQGRHYPNKIWGLEGFIGCCNEWSDNVCVNAPSFDGFIRDRRIANSSYPLDGRYQILQQDGEERSVKVQAEGLDMQNVKRVRFGRYCDIMASQYNVGDTSYGSYYAAGQMASTNAQMRGRTVYRGGNNYEAVGGLAFEYPRFDSLNSTGYITGRLCYFGEMEFNE
jgi:hypothetical protein